MFRTAIAWIAVAAVTTATAVTTIELAAPSIIKEHRPVVIKHKPGAQIQAIYGTSDPETGEFEWAHLPDDHFERRESETFFSAPVGEYLITQGDSLIVRVVPEGNPRPRPNPKPGPHDDEDDDGGEDEDEPPAPNKLKITWVIWVEEISERSRHQAELDVWTNPEVLISIADRGYKWKVYDDDDPAAKPFLAASEGKRPAIILMESPTRFLVFPAPKSPAELETLIQRHAIR